MATVWKKEIKKVKSVYSKKELLTMSFKEYWSQGLRERAPEMMIKGGHLESPAHIWWMKELKRLAEEKKEAEMKHQRKMDSILNGYICEMSEGMMSLSHVG